MKKVNIYFKLRKQGEWEAEREVTVDPSQPWEAKRVVIKYMSKGARMTIRDKDMQILSSETCIRDVIEDGTNTIFIVPESELLPGDLANISQNKPDSSSVEEHRRKRGRDSNKQEGADNA